MVKRQTSRAEEALLGASSAQTLTRDLEPVIFAGATISRLIGTPVDELWVYAYSGGVWTQIPAQVDEVTAVGSYVAIEDSLLDENDEIVFMAKDLGDQMASTLLFTGSLSIGHGWYEIEVTNPVSPAQKGWAYLVHSRVLTRTFAGDYVDFEPATHRINAETFSLGFATPNAWADYLTLGAGGVDILDRSKMRLLCQRRLDPRTWLCPITEDEVEQLQDDLIKDGPVRVIVRAGRVLGYGSMATWTIVLNTPTYLAGDIRFSMDFDPVVSGATYYNAAVPSGVTVDGVPDSVATEPLSPWWQLTTDAGTLVHVSDTDPIGGTASNYYEDDATIDNSDTGDQRRYGDAGIYVENPNLAFDYTFSVYALPGAQPNVGAAYEAFFRHPLSVKATLLGDTRPHKIYLPSTLRQSAG
jgi:hypothetical protein